MLRHTNADKNRKPLVGIPASVRMLEIDMPFHGNGEQYHAAVCDHVGANVFTIPSLDDTGNALELLDHVDGILLTGSFSNIHPQAYEGTITAKGQLFDLARDRNSFGIIHESVRRGIPLFGICRGLQEFNVALGGSLHQEIHKVEGRFDHRSDENLALKEHFLPAHEIEIFPGGILAELGHGHRVMVNTSHTQGVDQLADGLFVEAVGDDGTIEAVSVEAAPGWTLAVQFHPEWYIQETPFYASLFASFRQAVIEYRNRVHGSIFI